LEVNIFPVFELLHTFSSSNLMTTYFSISIAVTRAPVRNNQFISMNTFLQSFSP